MKRILHLSLALIFVQFFLLLLPQQSKAQGCVAEFTYADSCLTVDFFDLSFDTTGGTIILWSWDFGDGVGSSTDPNPSYTYASTGTYVVELSIRTNTACIAFFTDTISVTSCGGGGPAVCRSEFGYTDSCLTVNFINTSTASPGTIVATNWDFGDGTFGSSYSPSHTYLSSGSYTVCLEIVTSDGCSDNFCDVVSISCGGGGACNADFFTIDSCTTINFFDLSFATPGVITDWEWDFGDGNFSALNEPSHTYIFPDTYTVSLTITTSDTCVSTISYDIDASTCVVLGCDANFTSSSTCRTVDFSDLSSASAGFVSAWSWDFGDGGSSSLQDPTHTYAFDGGYEVCLTIVDSAGCTDTYCDSVFVFCGAPACEADFEWSTVGDCEVQFTDSSSSTPGSIISWEWDFGDSTFSSMENPPVHTYSGTGSYTVCLTITTDDSCSDTYCETISITCGGPAICSANFSTTDSCRTVDFLDLSSSSPGVIVSYDWDFGDGGSASTANPSHTYAADSIYTVCLTITTSDSCSDTFCRFVTVSCVAPPSCNADFSWADSCLTTNFTSLSTASPGTIASYTWDFGDFTSGSGPNPSHTYAGDGLYMVMLAITTTDGCNDTIIDSVIVNACPPTCSANIDTMDFCPDFVFMGSAAGTGPFTYEWDFGDAAGAFGDTVSHTYTTNGTYAVVLTIRDVLGCGATDTLTHFVGCLPPPTCSVSAAYADSCPTIYFTATGSGSGGLDYTWDFDDGTFGTGANTSHTYLANGSYDVVVTMTDSTGCLVRDTQNVVISCIAPPVCGVTTSITGTCPTFNFDATGTGTGTISYAWDFDDGDTDVVEDPSHTFTANGGYFVCVTITDSLGCTDTHCDSIFVTCIPPPCTVTKVTTGTCPTFNFDATATGGGSITYAWDFGDGDTDSVEDPSHTYTMNGGYYVCVTITDSTGCSATECDSVFVTCLPDVCNADFAYADSCPNYFFTNASTISSTGPAAYSWTFGDGGSSSLMNPSYTYTANGDYPVMLVVEDMFSGCRDTMIDTINVTCLTPGSCVGAFTYSDTASPTISFTDVSTPDSGATITSISWNFGDGASGSGDTISHTYTVSGFYGVCATIMTSSGCTDVFCDSINVVIVGSVEPVFETEVELYPNPASTYLNVSVSGSSNDVQITMLDLRGKVLHDWPFVKDGEQIELGDIANGVYLFRIESEGKTSFERIMVRH